MVKKWYQYQIVAENIEEMASTRDIPKAVSCFGTVVGKLVNVMEQCDIHVVLTIGEAP